MSTAAAHCVRGGALRYFPFMQHVPFERCLARKQTAVRMLLRRGVIFDYAWARRLSLQDDHKPDSIDQSEAEISQSLQHIVNLVLSNHWGVSLHDDRVRVF